MDKAKFPVLYVDDEPSNIATFRYAFGDRYRVLTAGGGEHALEVLEREDVAVLLTDQRMPGMTGVELCRRIRQARPHVVRLIASAYTDLNATVDAINEGQVLRFVTKPWRNEELEQILDQSLEVALLQRNLQQLQERLLRADAGPRLETMAAELASTLTPLTHGLSMNAQSLSDLVDAGLDAWPDRQRAEELVRLARQTQSEADELLGRLRGTVHKLKQPMGGASRTKMATDLSRAVRATMPSLRALVEGRAVLRLVLKADPIVALDPSHVGQILHALVTNAVEAPAPTGAVTVEIRVEGSPEEARLIVEDDGAGMAPDVQARALDPQYSTKGQAGMGLPTVAQLLSSVGGHMEIRSNPGSGTEVTLGLPRVAATLST